MPGQELKQCDFLEIEGERVKNKCSPKIPDPNFFGILINAPSVVSFCQNARDPLTGSSLKIVIAGMYRLKHDTAGLCGKFHSAVLLVAENVHTHEVYTGRMGSFGSPAREEYRLEDEGLTPDDFKDVVVTEYFNPDLASVLMLPEIEAEYIVYATLGPYTSNATRIKVVKSEKLPSECA